jgi:hypothetical protein
MYAAEFTLHAKPGHYAEVAALYSAFAADFLSDHPALESVMILGDEASGVVRGIGVFTDRPAADSVNSDPSLRRSTTRWRRCSRTARGAWSSSCCTCSRGLTRADLVALRRLRVRGIDRLRLG